MNQTSLQFYEILQFNMVFYKFNNNISINLATERAIKKGLLLILPTYAAFIVEKCLRYILRVHINIYACPRKNIQKYFLLPAPAMNAL